MAIEWPNWCRGSLAPDEVIGEQRMLRWFVFKCRAFAIYVHKHQGNDPRYPHDHPADNLSIRLAGTVLEYRPGVDPFDESGRAPTWPMIRNPEHTRVVHFDVHREAFEKRRPLPRFVFRRAEDVHRLEAADTGPAWSIWIRGRCRRPWGFFTPTGWRRAVTKHQPGPMS